MGREVVGFCHCWYGRGCPGRVGTINDDSVCGSVYESVRREKGGRGWSGLYVMSLG